jgi:hypothetical protein
VSADKSEMPENSLASKDLPRAAGSTSLLPPSLLDPSMVLGLGPLVALVATLVGTVVKAGIGDGIGDGVGDGVEHFASAWSREDIDRLCQSELGSIAQFSSSDSLKVEDPTLLTDRPDERRELVVRVRGVLEVTVDSGAKGILVPASFFSFFVDLGC